VTSMVEAQAVRPAATSPKRAEGTFLASRRTFASAGTFTNAAGSMPPARAKLGQA